jgi:hypothetical protein
VPKSKITIPVTLLILGITLSVVLFQGRDGRISSPSTKSRYLNNFSVTNHTYSRDTANVLICIDSLISIGVTTSTGPKTKTYFNGQFYEDSTVREWAIDLPMKSIEYEKHFIDTIIYKPNDTSLFAGLLISRIHNKVHPESVEYFGNGFVCRKKLGKYIFKIYGRRTKGSKSIRESSRALRKIYFDELGRTKESYNLNDVRYFGSEDFVKIQWQ